MTVEELLKKQKGKYDIYELHYQKYAKYIPFSFTDNKKNSEMKVVEYRIKESEGQSFDLKLNYLGKKKDRVLIIVWEK